MKKKSVLFYKVQYYLIVLKVKYLTRDLTIVLNFSGNSVSVLPRTDGLMLPVLNVGSEVRAAS